VLTPHAVYIQGDGVLPCQDAYPSALLPVRFTQNFQLAGASCLSSIVTSVERRATGIRKPRFINLDLAGSVEWHLGTTSCFYLEIILDEPRDNLYFIWSCSLYICIYAQNFSKLLFINRCSQKLYKIIRGSKRELCRGISFIGSN